MTLKTEQRIEAEIIYEHVLETFKTLILKSHLKSSFSLQEEHVLTLCSGCKDPVTNGIFALNDLDAIGIKKVDQATNALLKQMIPHIVWLAPSAHTTIVQEMLKKKGYFHPGSFQSLFLDLNSLSDLPQASKEIEVKKVDNMLDMNKWCDILMPIFFPQIPPKDRIRELYLESQRNSGFSQNASLWSYLAKVKGKNVGISQTYFTEVKGEKIAGIWALGVNPEVRKQGFATSLTVKQLEDIRSKGYRKVIAILAADETGRSTTEKLGFRDAYPIYPYFSKNANFNEIQ